MTEDINILESYEYQQRTKEIKQMTWLSFGFTALYFLLTLVIGFTVQSVFSVWENLLLCLGIGLPIPLICFISLLVCLRKRSYLMKNYQNFRPCDVKLVHAQAMPLSRFQVYRFEERIEIDGEWVTAVTAYLFHAYDELCNESFHNRTFLCLYDSKGERLYVIHKVEDNR